MISHPYSILSMIN